MSLQSWVARANLFSNLTAGSRRAANKRKVYFTTSGDRRRSIAGKLQ